MALAFTGLWASVLLLGIAAAIVPSSWAQITLPLCPNGGQDLTITTTPYGGALQLAPTCQLTPVITQCFSVCATIRNDTDAPYSGSRLITSALTGGGYCSLDPTDAAQCAAASSSPAALGTSVVPLICTVPCCPVLPPGQVYRFGPFCSVRLDSSGNAVCRGPDTYAPVNGSIGPSVSALPSYQAVQVYSDASSASVLSTSINLKALVVGPTTGYTPTTGT